jgi:hypothetical protein
MDCLYDKKIVLKFGSVMYNELIKQVEMSLKVLMFNGNLIVQYCCLITWLRTAKETVGNQGPSN